LLHGKALRIEGGPVEIGRRRCCRFHDHPHRGGSPFEKDPIEGESI
jgi:hypothetical protein